MGRKGKGSKAALEKLDQKLDELTSNRNILLSRLSEVDNSIAQTRSKKAEIAANASIKASISTLPGEIVAEILETCYFSLSNKHKFYFPVYVSLVSKEWRNIVQNTSSLWRSIRASPLYLNRLANYIEHCGAQSLDITFTAKLVDGEVGIMTALSMLILKIDNWRRVEFFLDCRRILFLMMPKLSKASVPRLETLSFFIQRYEYHIYHDGILFEMDAPRLSDICLSQPSLLWSSPIFCNLTTLRVKSDFTAPSTEMKHLSCALHACASTLHELALDLPLVTSGITDQAENIVMPVLRSLEITYPLGRSLVAHNYAVFRTLSAPALETLSLTGFGHQAWHEFIQSLKHSGSNAKYPNVVELKLHECDALTDVAPFGESEWVTGVIGDNFINAFPALRRLECNDTDPTRILRTLVKHMKAEMCPWSDLQSLKVESFEISVLPTFLRMRAKCKKPFSVVELPDIYRRLKDHRVEVIEEYTRVEFYKDDTEDDGIDYDFGPEGVV